MNVCVLGVALIVWNYSAVYGVILLGHFNEIAKGVLLVQVFEELSS